jgi:chromosome segregation ATPase
MKTNLDNQKRQVGWAMASFMSEELQKLCVCVCVCVCVFPNGRALDAAGCWLQAQELKKSMEESMEAKEVEEEQAREQERVLDTLLSRRTQHTQRRDDITKRIRELGSLPTEAFEKYRSKSTKELHRMLKQVAEELKEFSHVNKKALDQYVTFTEQREDLLKRQRELQSGEQTRISNAAVVAK